MKDWLSIHDYSYDLPEERIASHPIEDRDKSKLLVYRNGAIEHEKFAHIAEYLDVNSILFFNDTRVIPARLQFRKETGAAIEVMLLSPNEPGLTQANMNAAGLCSWNCMIGNQKRWTRDMVLSKEANGVKLRARLIDAAKVIVEFDWSPASMTFAEVIHAFGDTPLPPYIKRETIAADIDRYQTIYAHHQGAVAAPTAGLHFTDDVLESVRQKGIASDYLTLHVSAGTFLPVKHENALEHTMHEEQVVVSRDNVNNMLSGRSVVAVGTTSLRTLESIYWYGHKLQTDRHAPFAIEQEDPYKGTEKVSLHQSLHNVLAKMGTADQLHGRTSIFIRPPYNFQVCDALITNFHQPGSTLILLVAAFVGPDWKMIYDQALSKGYRFLSYGDSSLLIRRKS